MSRTLGSIFSYGKLGTITTKKLYRFVHGGQCYAIGRIQNMFVALHADNSYSDFSAFLSAKRESKTDKTIEEISESHIIAYLGMRHTVKTFTAQGPKFKGWVGDVQPQINCAVCNATGKITCPKCVGMGGNISVCAECGHEHVCRTCYECGGGKEISCDNCNFGQTIRAKFGMINGVIYDLTLLPVALDALPTSSSIQISTEALSLLRLDGNGWRIILFPVEDIEIPELKVWGTKTRPARDMDFAITGKEADE